MSSKKTIPDLLRMFLQEFQSPPFPKEGYLLDVFKNENPVDLELIKENDHLGENLVKSLRLMLMFFQDDLEVPLTDSGSLNSKLSVVKIKRLFELVILNGFELLELEASIITHSGLHYNTCIITSLLNTDLSAVGVHSKTIWCIYNEIVNSFSKADLRYLPLFALFYNQILIKFADSDILQDWLVKRHIVEHFKVFMFDAEKYPAIVQFTGINSYDNSPVIVSQDNFKDIGPDISTKNSSFSGDVSSDFSHMSLSRTQSQFSINTGKQPQPQQEGYQYYQEASNYQDQLPPLQQPQPSVALPFKFADIQFP
ncbi:hypothetical protein CANTEDRAFT_115444 [Yamadazyma tenuis ATCC 10573]|uniref:Uncharacterized protein n=2 Tax=Candida tenuis TaxID=2315449 RepID=G3BA17_CANTC|nr:uncharacterized protein CANTEDRAFT_115444 [Yamadazyma tenuis ATCC 10573]EGV61989.1 hypothetical protein CANTEDRAFT_115444 [Yamadazyma tenuis ATCC 10573]